MINEEKRPCPTCGGTGRVSYKPCTSCRATGFYLYNPEPQTPPKLNPQLPLDIIFNYNLAAIVPPFDYENDN